MSKVKVIDANPNDKRIEAITAYGESYKILDMYESFTGWYWFVLDDKPYPDDPDVKYGYVCGFENEFGTFSVSELKAAGVWKVPKVNWSSNSHVSLVPRSMIAKHL